MKTLTYAIGGLLGALLLLAWYMLRIACACACAVTGLLLLLALLTGIHSADAHKLEIYAGVLFTILVLLEFLPQFFNQGRSRARSQTVQGPQIRSRGHARVPHRGLWAWLRHA